MRRFGLVLDISELDYFESLDVEKLLLPPGFPYPKSEVEKLSKHTCFSLNELIENGEISKFSTCIAPAIRNMLGRIQYPSVEAIASQNDVYQYHLRLQYLFLVSLERFLERHRNFILELYDTPYRRYYSPMRPELGVLYDNRRMLAFLAVSLVNHLGGEVAVRERSLAAIKDLKDVAQAAVRKFLIEALLAYKLIEKSYRAVRRSRHADTTSQTDGDPTVGIIVRTDSEVISANFLIRKLEKRGIAVCVIHDEILSSTTTLSRLSSLGIPSVSIGARYGVWGAINSIFRRRPNLVFASKANQDTDSASERILLSNESALFELKDRLLDFYKVQNHFSLELDKIVRDFNIKCLVTYAYVDQWGGVIKSVGDAHGIPTVAIQNAAQDPEEYPKLCWADFYCVESMYLKKKLVEFGYPSERLAATGLPQFSSVQQVGATMTAIGSSERRLLILTQPIYQTYYETLIEECADFCRKHNFELQIKYHPRQSGREYEAAIAAANHGIQISVFKDESLDELIVSSTAVISVVSAALIRAINLGIPTISFLPLEEKHLDLYYASNSTVFCVADVFELRTLLNRLAENYTEFAHDFEEKRGCYLREHSVFEPGGDPSENIAGFVEQIFHAYTNEKLLSSTATPIVKSRCSEW